METGFHKILEAPRDASFGGHPSTIVISAVAFWALFGFLQYTRCLVPKKRGLKEGDILEWNISESCRILSAVAHQNCDDAFQTGLHDLMIEE